uniref:Uncharacterized protein TCIL3000_11_10160 n=1 Tax=Trypanosoma congolense (strain IL3000) TaxID=1068625 RepID=G0V1M3_TRYCI|nr:unnamed protein product [Trypanosoma congolense IL3000]
MGNTTSFCCCCPTFFDEHTSRSPNGGEPRSNYRGATSSSFLNSGRFPAEGRIRCDLCGSLISAVIFDGHRESCRENNLRSLLASQQQQQQQKGCEEQQGETGIVEDCALWETDPDELCVVCLASRRAYAFLPCGHVSCCERCGRALTRCPMCRAPRSGLCNVSPDVFLQFKCRSCGLVIAPELHGGHREVCGLRMRLLQEKNDKKKDTNDVFIETEESDDMSTVVGVPYVDIGAHESNFPCGREETRCTMHVCVQCHSSETPLVIILPCGHRLLCEMCCKDRKTCPVCLHSIESSIKSFCS